MGTITLSDKQQRRGLVLGKVSSGEIDHCQASDLLGISQRQVRRALARLRTEGLGSLLHGNTGRAPHNRTSEAIRQKLTDLTCREKEKQGLYHDFNTCHLQEMLAEREGIPIGRSTLDRLLKEVGTRKRKRGRPRGSFKRRERMPQEGQMLLTDASSHEWLERRGPSGPRMCLLGAIDDARSQIVHLRFWPTECQAGYITMAREVTTTLGIPMSFYHDRHTILCSPKEQTIEDELAGREPMSQFQAILHELGAESIRALTPQAKGRIERMWQTLQDRLIKEMRLAGINTLEEANAFLLGPSGYIERYNARFCVEPRNPQSAWVKPEVVEDELDLPYYFAAKEERTVRADHTLCWKGKLLQIQRKRGERSLAGERVRVHITPEGECFLYHGKEKLAFREQEAPLARRVAVREQVREEVRPAKPPMKPQEPSRSPEERRAARRRQMAHLHAGPCA